MMMNDKATPSGILVSGQGKVQNWMWAGGFSHYAIISQTSCKDGRHHIPALKTYQTTKSLRFYTILFIRIGIKHHIAWFYYFIKRLQHIEQTCTALTANFY